MRGEDWDFRMLVLLVIAVKCDITYECKITSLAIMQKFSFLGDETDQHLCGC